MNNNKTIFQKGKSSFWILAIIAFLIAAGVWASSNFETWKKDPNLETVQSELVLEQQLILTQTDVINTNWLRTLNPLVKKVEGRIVWSNTLQKGVMEFVGLPKIDNKQQYRLWIYDLVGIDTKPILSTEFNKVITDKFLIPFSSDVLITAPFKFELMLKTDGEETSQPLLLAQP